jgi:hypothetical protein
MSERIRFIDALRGISLAGIVMAHFGEQYLGFMPPPGRPYNIHGMAEWKIRSTHTRWDFDRRSIADRAARSGSGCVVSATRFELDIRRKAPTVG